YGEWSQAGVMLTISGEDLWRCEVPESEWPADTETRKAITRDFDGKWGDRRQEIVFIGQHMREGVEERLRNALDACLLNDDKFQKLAELFEDGFENWIEMSHEGHDHINGYGHGDHKH
ncbi:hypothetical protein AAE478_007273, partial [Parahypoxylon ruwenzoriense]